jgi:hypothetical protein
MKGRQFEIPAYAGERLVQLGRKEKQTALPGRRDDRTGGKKKGEQHQQSRNIP